MFELDYHSSFDLCLQNWIQIGSRMIKIGPKMIKIKLITPFGKCPEKTTSEKMYPERGSVNIVNAYSHFLFPPDLGPPGTDARAGPRSGDGRLDAGAAGGSGKKVIKGI